MRPKFERYKHPFYSANAYAGPERTHYRDSGCTRLGQAIAKARLKADLKQAQLAAKIGVARSRIAQWEGAKRPVPWPIAQVLAVELDCADAWDLERFSIYRKPGSFARLVR